MSNLILQHQMNWLAALLLELVVLANDTGSTLRRDKLRAEWESQGPEWSLAEFLDKKAKGGG